jgi:zinc/manganese transport system permease protein
VGSILTVAPSEVVTLAVLYALVGALHWLVRRPLLEIALDPDGAVERGRRVRAWDFLFYATFGLVVTSSVRIAGVLLVFRASSCRPLPARWSRAPSPRDSPSGGRSAPS